MTINYSPSVTQPLPPNPGPASTATGGGTITACVLPGGGATSGTFTFQLSGNLTCSTAQNVTGQLDITWADSTTSKTVVTGLTQLGSVGGTAGLQATVTQGRFAGDLIVIANLRDPLALLRCLTTGLAQASGITSMTFTVPTSSVTCTGSSTITYNPGLTFTPRPVHYHETEQYTPCVSSDPTLTAGSSSTDIDIPAGSCLALPSIFEDPAYTIDWGNGNSSTIDLMFSDAIIGGTEQVTGVGTVTAGQFTGATAVIVWIYPVIDPQQCQTQQGLTTQNGVLSAHLTLA
jgi:hypothetical protein